jgi:molybdate transport system substrate-binding protein
MSNLNILGAGAAKGVVEALQGGFEAETGTRLQSTFGPVGTIREQWMAGAACDVVILTAALIEALLSEGFVDAGSSAPIGGVSTGIAVRAGEAHPLIEDGEELKRALLAADALYIPDTRHSTAGAHFGRILDQLGIRESVAGRLREYPGGAAAMQALAGSERAALGCTQVTEILHTPGIEVAGTLPPGFELTTVYSAAVSTKAEAPGLARDLVRLLTGAWTLDVRRANGFEVG